MRVWNRRELIEEPEVGAGAIRFAYGNPFGRFLAKTILCRKFVSNLYAAWQRSGLSKKKVEKFKAQYHISTEDCTEQDFPNFNAFFTRQRKNYVNLTAENELPAIADSKNDGLEYLSATTDPAATLSPSSTIKYFTPGSVSATLSVLTTVPEAVISSVISYRTATSVL